MNSIQLYIFANAGILGAFVLIRIPYILQSVNQAATPKDRNMSIFYTFISALMVAVGFYYLFYPSAFSKFSTHFPHWLRISGIAIGSIGNSLLLWTHLALNKNFAMYVTSTKHHKLVTSGPYSWVIHPMYTAFFLIAFGFFLVSSNLIFGGFILAIIYPLKYRMDSEEKYLIKIFGEAYTGYMKEKKRLFPFFY